MASALSLGGRHWARGLYAVAARRASAARALQPPALQHHHPSAAAAWPGLAAGGPLHSSGGASAAALARGMHTSRSLCGLEEFLPSAEVKENGVNGRPWLASELRAKSNHELHQLWYVLLKERNMLMTLKQEARRLREFMPYPERLKKVRKSMARIKVVIHERDLAVKAARKADPKRIERWRENFGQLQRARPRRVQISPDEAATRFAQILGVVRPGLARPGQPQRPLTKSERAEFRKELAQRREEQVAEQRAAIRAELQEETDAVLEEAIAAIKEHIVAEGITTRHELSLRHQLTLFEGKSRGLESVPSTI